jgi:hypothetical protein
MNSPKMGLFMEFNLLSQEAAGYSGNELFDYLLELGFTVYRFNTAHRLEQVI